jgi:hypothetical protein
MSMINRDRTGDMPLSGTCHSFHGPDPGFTGRKKYVSDLQIYRAAHRNRTDDLRITRVSPCVARGPKPQAGFMFAGGRWW